MGKFAEPENEQKKKTGKPAVQPPAQTVQRDLADVNGPEGGMLPGEVSAKIQSLRGTGQKLSEKNLQQYSQKFGRDMSDVHVHTDTASDTISRSLNARAFTIGSDVFLTKGINPDGGGRDAQTMTHELTHVVQQGGHASAGPLKLGAADTAQEHEAESTAQREFDPKLQGEDDTIQRGFWGDLGNAVLGKTFSALGIGEAMEDFMTGDKKVKAAIEKMPGNQRQVYTTIESSIKNYEENALPRNSKEMSALQDTVSSSTDDNQRDAALNQLTQKINEREMLKGQLQDYLDQQYNMLQNIDSTITKDDINRYRSGRAKTFFSSIFSSIGGKILGSFEIDPDKRAAAQAKGRNSINNWFASKNKHSTALGETEEDKARKAEEIKEKQKNLIDSIWTDVQGDQQLSQKYTKLLLKREISMNYMTMIQESLKDNESEADIKSSVLMMLRNSGQGAAGNQGAAGAQPGGVQQPQPQPQQ